MSEINYEFVNNNTKSTVLFLHGWGLSGNSFDGIIKRLNNVSYIKLDLFGFGNTKEPKDYFDVYEYAYQIFLLLKKINIESIVIVGHSFGGRLAIILSSVFDLNVKSVILTSSAGINKFSIKKHLKIKLYKVSKLLVKIGVANKKILNRFGSKDYKNASEIMKRILSRVVSQDLRFLLKNISAEVYLVWDKKDSETPYWICKKIHKLTRQSKIITYDNGGHFTAFNNVNKFALLINVIVDN
jgi:pimeloyl-ACP methyl ester carboxylesterase